MIWSVFPFFNELDILEIKLAEQASIVDRFVLVESNLTHSGKEKPLYFEENRERYAEWLPKIHHIVHDADPNPDAIWQRERAQRNAGLNLDVFAGDDIVFVSDLDEIVRADVIRAYDGQITSFLLPMHVYRLNWRWTHEPVQTWQIAGAAPAYKWPKDRGDWFRQDPPEAIVPDAGWHFTYMGGVEMIRHKLENFAHCTATAGIAGFGGPDAAFAVGRDLFGRDEIELETVPDERLPGYVTANRRRFAHLFA